MPPIEEHELVAIETAYKALSELDSNAIYRSLDYLKDRLVQVAIEKAV